MNKKILILLIIAAVVSAGGAAIYFGKFSGEQKDQADTPQKVAENELNGILVAIGSSFTKATNISSAKRGDNEDHSFSTGTEILSIYGHLKKKESNLTSVNLASAGAISGDIVQKQLPELLRHNPKYVTLDPGADIVTRNSVGDLKRDLSAILRAIDPRATVFLITYPDFVKMRTAPYKSCKENRLGVNLGNLTESNILAFNQAIKEVAAGRQNVVLLDIYGLLGKDDISDYDCLHANAKGQEKVAMGFINIIGAVEKSATNITPAPATASETPKMPELLWQNGGPAIAGAFADADVVDLGNGRYRMYYSAEPETPGFQGQVYSALSSDGITWEKEGGVRMTWATFPSVIKLPDGRYRMYFQNEGLIKSAVSDDGLSWTNEPGTRIDRTNTSGLNLANVAAPTVLKMGSEYIMVYRGTINEKYPAKVPNQDTQLFLWAVSKDGLSFEKRGIAMDSRNSTFSGLLDGAELVAWDDGTVRLYFWSYRGVYHTTYRDGAFDKEATFDYTNNANPMIQFPENPPGDPTLIKINGKWLMYYGQHGEGIYYAQYK